MEQSAAATFCATLVDEFVRHGMTDAVVAPGSRSTAMALALDHDARMRVHVHPDERSAAFVAVGLGLATGRAAAVLTTSGTAAVELHPAVVEASYNRVPLVALTADRPPELHGVGAPQTIDQHDLYGSAARAFIDAGVAHDQRPERARAIACDVLAAAQGSPAGPVQLNLPFREPLLGSPDELPPPDHEPSVFSPGRAPTEDELALLVDAVDGRRGVIIAGGHLDHPEAVLALAGSLRWPLFADPRSGCRVPHPSVIAHFDALLRVDDWAEAPEVVLRLGSLPASKVLTQWLGGLAARQIGLDRDGATSDPDRCLERVVDAAPGLACEALGQRVRSPTEGAWLDRWRDGDDRASDAMSCALIGHDRLTDPEVARLVVADLPDGSDLVVSSSMPIRDVEWYSQPRERLRVLANRGANGIDGVVSTAVGVALAGVPTTVLMGDLAFVHDINGLLSVADRDIDLTVVVVDNDGGGIFSFLPQASALDESQYERLFGTPHGLDLVAVARAHGVAAYEVVSSGELADALDHRRRGARVIVIRTDRHANVGVHDALHDAVATALAR